MNPYKVTFINQETGAYATSYVLAAGLEQVESEYADITKIEPLTPLDDLTDK